jgi:type IV pilus assembly protein PilW
MMFVSVRQTKMYKVEGGFTLIELMIAMLLSLIVIGVVGGLFLANSNTFRATDDASRLQENGRFALQTLSRVVRQAGHIPVDVVQLLPARTGTNNDAYPVIPSGVMAGAGNARFVSGTDGTGPNNSDSLVVAFRGADGGQIVDCAGVSRAAAPATLGTSVAALPTTPTYSRFFVAASSNGVAGDNSLWCEVTTAGVTIAPAFELINGVESFQVLYVVDAAVSVTPPGGGAAKLVRDFAPDYYTSANKLDGNEFNNVIGVQIALTLRGAERTTIDKDRDSDKIYPFGMLSKTTAIYDGTANGDLGAQYTIKSEDKRRTFRTITSTITIRNRAA